MTKLCLFYNEALEGLRGLLQIAGPVVRRRGAQHMPGSSCVIFTAIFIDHLVSEATPFSGDSC